ncbi:WSC domain containing protein [Lactarius tabidus]
MHRLSSLALASVFVVQVLGASVHPRASDPPVVYTSTGPWYNIGCFSDSADRQRALPYSANDGSTTVESCVSTCQGLGYSLAGVEFGMQCFCGSKLENSSQPSADGCNMACEGNPSEICGGSNRLVVYSESAVPSS